MSFSHGTRRNVTDRFRALSFKRSVNWSAIGILVVGLGACQTTNPDGLSQKAHDQAQKVDAQLQQSGAVIVTRVTNKGGSCPLAEVRLRPVLNGRIDPSVFYTVGQTRSISGQSHLAGMSSLMWRAATFQISSVMEDIFPKDGSTSFVAIPPGDYFVTSATCDYGNGSITRLGADYPNAFTSETGVIGPVPGANFIHVRQGDILDAGILDIVETGTTPGLLVDGKIGKAVAMSVPENYRQILQRELPDLYRRMRFTTFASKKN